MITWLEALRHRSYQVYITTYHSKAARHCVKNSIEADPMKYRSEACGVAGPVIAHMCRDKGQATMDAIKIRTSKDKDKDVLE